MAVCPRQVGALPQANGFLFAQYIAGSNMYAITADRQGRVDRNPAVLAQVCLIAAAPLPLGEKTGKRPGFIRNVLVEFASGVRFTITALAKSSRRSTQKQNPAEVFSAGYGGYMIFLLVLLVDCHQHVVYARYIKQLNRAVGRV